MHKAIKLIIMFSAMLGADLYTKYMVMSHMKIYESIPVIKGFFNITYILNPGAAFGIFQNQSDEFRKIFLVGVAILVCLLIIFLIFKDFNNKVSPYIYTMILAGAAGNITDRIKLSQVVDFLDFYYKSYHWYTFNIADCYIVVGVAILLLEPLIQRLIKGGNLKKRIRD